MNTIVCVKEVPDPNAPVENLRVQDGRRVVTTEDTPRVISVFDENAVEAALQLKEEVGGKMTVVSLGRQSAETVIKRAIAMGADDGILLNDEAFEGSDSYSTATILAAAIKKMGEYDLILAGQESADTNTGAVGAMVAELLSIPSVAFVRKIQPKDGKLQVERAFVGGYEVLECQLPALVTVSGEINQPRYPNVMRFMQARRRAIPKWTATDLGVDSSKIGAGGALIEVVKADIPIETVRCELMEASTLSDAAVKLAEKLRENKII